MWMSLSGVMAAGNVCRVRAPKSSPLEDGVHAMKHTLVGATLSIVLLTSITGLAQTQTLAPGEADPGVRPTRMIDRAEVRASRVEVQAGATRRVHTHDDVEYHLWI